MAGLLAQAVHPDRPIIEEAPGPPEPELGARLQPRGDGYFYPDPRFTVRIFPDGSVAFSPRDFRPGYAGFILRPLRPGVSVPWIEDWVLGLTAWQARGYAVAPYPPPLLLGPPGQVDYELCRPDYTCWRLPNILDEVVIGFGVNADLNDALWRAVGVAPYRPERARVLDATFDLRVRMALQTRRDDMQVTLAHLPIALARVWLFTPLPAWERRRILFELWLETDGGPAGAEARAEIERFIRTALPCGSRDAFTASELRAYAQAAPGRRFAPYRGCGRQE